MKSFYLALGTFFLVTDPAPARRCEERPLNIIIDSTNLTSRRNFNIQLAIINNVTSRLRRGAGDVTVLANIYQYNRNDMCRMPEASPCVKQSPDVPKPQEKSQKRVIAGLYEYNSTLAFERFPNQPFCLGCAEYLRVMLTHRYQGNGLGLILTTYPSMKKYIHSKHYDRYRKGGEYYLALMYNTTNPASRKVIARRSSNVSQIVEAILQTLCPDRFSPHSGSSARTTAKPTTTTILVTKLLDNVTSTSDSSPLLIARLNTTKSPTPTNLTFQQTLRTKTNDTTTLRGMQPNSTSLSSSLTTITSAIQNRSKTPDIPVSMTTAPDLIMESVSVQPTASLNDVPQGSSGMSGTTNMSMRSTTTLTSSIPPLPSVYLITQSLSSLPATISQFSSPYSINASQRSWNATLLSTIGAKSVLPSMVPDFVWESIGLSHGLKSKDSFGSPSEMLTAMPGSRVENNATYLGAESDQRVSGMSAISSSNASEASQSIIPSPSANILNITNHLGGVSLKTVHPSLPLDKNITSAVQLDRPQSFRNSDVPITTLSVINVNQTKNNGASAATKIFDWTNRTNESIRLSASIQIGSSSSFVIDSRNSTSVSSFSVPFSSILQTNTTSPSTNVTHANKKNKSGVLVPILSSAMSPLDSRGISSDVASTSAPATLSPLLSRSDTPSTDLSRDTNSSANVRQESATPMFAYSSTSVYDDERMNLSATPSFTLQTSVDEGLNSIQSLALFTVPLNSSILIHKPINQTDAKNVSTINATRNATDTILPSNITAGKSMVSPSLNAVLASDRASFSIIQSPSQSMVNLNSYGHVTTASIWKTESLKLLTSSAVFFNRSEPGSKVSKPSQSLLSFTVSMVVTRPNISVPMTSLQAMTSSMTSSSAVPVPAYIVPKVVKNMQFLMEQQQDLYTNTTSLQTSEVVSWLTRFITNTSAILDQIEVEEEENIPLRQSRMVREKSLDFVEYVNNATLTLGQKLPVGKKVNVTVDDLLVEIHAVDPLNFDGYTFIPQISQQQEVEQPDEQQQEQQQQQQPQQQQQQQQQIVQLSPHIFKNSSIEHKVAITSLFMDTIPAMRDTSGNFRDIGKTLTISLDVQLEYPLPKTLTYSLLVPRTNFTNYKCVFWNDSGAWDTSGCHVTSVNGTLVTCECNHLTSFSILMQVNEFETHSSHAYVLSIISYIGCSISITGCILLMLTFTMCGRLLKVSRNVIHMNLALAMTISNGLFITADSVHPYKGLCLTVSIVMLYSYLASFFWMLVEGLHVYLMIVKVFKSPSMMKVYLIIGWLLPAVIVTVAGMKFHVNFTRDDFCWISTQGNVIWVFVGPVLLIIGINIVILMKALSTSYKMAVAETAFLKLQETARLTMLLMPIFGLTWIFGLLAINKQMVVFQYMFTIANSLQGVYIFVCYCLLNNEVRTEFQRIRQKYSYGSAHSTSTESNSTYNPLFTKTKKAKSVVSMDTSNNVKLTRYDSVKTEMTSPSRTSSMHYDSLAKRTNKGGIELMRLNESFNETPDKDVEQPYLPNDTLSMSSSLCPEEHDYGLRLKYDHVPLSNGFVGNGNGYHGNGYHGNSYLSNGYRGLDAFQEADIFGGSVDNCRSMGELSNGTCTYDTFKRKNEN